MFQFYAGEGRKSNPEADIERYRARHRRLCRGQQPEATPSPQVEDLDVEDGRTRKVSAKWRQQQQIPVSNQFDGAEMHVGFNAFDFSASPEAFGETQHHQQSPAPLCPENQDQDSVKSSGLWSRRRQPGAPARELPTLGQDALWGGPVHYANREAQRRALYYEPQYYA